MVEIIYKYVVRNIYWTFIANKNAVRTWIVTYIISSQSGLNMGKIMQKVISVKLGKLIISADA